MTHQPLEGGNPMLDTSRNVNVALTAATDEDAHQVMAGILDAVRNALPDLAVVAASAYAFDINDTDDNEPAVQLVVDTQGGITGTWVNNPGRAEEFARHTGGVVVSLPVEVDHRREEVCGDDR